MGVRITSQEEVVSLYDSSSGIAFGPVFADGDSAQEFLDWVNAGHESNRIFHVGNEELLFIKDVRVYREHELQSLVNLWMDESAVTGSNEDTSGNGS